MTIREIKSRVQVMLDEAYKNVTNPEPDQTSLTLEQNHFVRKQDAEVISKICKDKKLHVSFRAAGQDTLQRIAEGHPCKGHKIMDKSIKFSTDHWTYQAPVCPGIGETEDVIFDKLKGYVGSPYIPRNPDGSVNYDTKYLTPKKFFKPNGKTDYTIFYLDGVYVLPTNPDPKIKSACEFAIYDITTLKETDLVNAYTGDYDMHDLICNGKRAGANSPEEHTTMDILNKALMESDKKRKQYVAMCGKERYHKSPYALIRHGAQTTFFDYLTTDKGEAEIRAKLEENLRAIKTEGYTSMIPYGDMVVKIDSNIAMFDSLGKMYILKGVGQVYKFYKNNGLTDQIPFYNFFSALHDIPKYAPEIEQFAAYINAILSVNRGLINHTNEYPWRHY